jgi:CheY-like chemotaxis protein
MIEPERTLLVLEKDDRARELVVFLLEREGYRVLAASTPEATLQILEAHPEIELLFADLWEPDAQALAELAEKAKELRPTLKMLYTAGLAGTMQTIRRDELAPNGPGPAARMLAVIKASLESG